MGYVIRHITGVTVVRVSFVRVATQFGCDHDFSTQANALEAARELGDIINAYWDKYAK
jgi:hypothetical protein